jgi:hypothetical protein
VIGEKKNLTDPRQTGTDERGSSRTRVGQEKNVRRLAFVLYYFVIDSPTGMRYISASASGREGKKIIENQQLATHGKPGQA